MLYPQQRERENRFKLALRTAIPTFLLLVLLFVLFFKNEEFLHFFTIVIVAVVIMAYYNLHVIYNGFTENMMDVDTDVFNFKAFKNIINKEYNPKSELTMMVVKIGDLESINAHYGRELANNVLRETIRTLLKKIEESGYKKIPAGYYGGGYFLLAFRASKSSVSEKLAPVFKRLKNFYIDDVELEIDSAMVTLDQGVFDEKIKVLLELVNGVHFDDIAFDGESSRDNSLKAIEHRIREAISKESISLQYQNVKNAKNDEIEIIEFSAKLIDHNKKFIHHSDIMPVINSLGLEKAFYLLVFKKIMQFVLDNNISVKFSTTISSFAFRHKEIYSELPLLMREYEIKPGQMILAISEEYYYKHIQRYKEIIEGYRAAGIGVAFTNIGSSGPALEYLKDIQVDYIKYDRYYVNSNNTLANTIYDGLDAIMSARGIKRWVVMVENAQVESYAKAKGIDYLQGWHIGKFQSVNELEKN